MKNNENRRLLAILLCAVMICATFSSCALFSVEGRETQTLHAGDTRAPLPPEITTAEVVSALVTTAPDGSELTSASPDTDDTSANTPVTTEEPDETTAQVDIITYNFEIVTLTEDLGSSGSAKSVRTLRYPKLEGLSNADIQDKINSSLASLADIEFDAKVTNVEEALADGITVQYEVKETSVTYLGNGLLSVRSAAEVKYSDGNGDAAFVYSYIFNLSTGKTVSMAKLYSDFDSIISLFTSGAFTLVSGSEDITDTISLAEMMEQYKNHKLYSTYPDSYFTPTSLVIVVELNEMSGYYAEFSISLDKVNGYINLSPSK